MAENFVNIIRDIRGSTNDPATDTSCIYGDIKSMHEEYQGFKQITDEERTKLENIEEEATKNSTDGFLLSRENHTGNMSMANVQDTPSRMAMTIHEKNKLEAINVDATKNDTDANLRNRATHTGTQSIDTITDTLTHVKMSVAERGKLSAIAIGATKNATDAELRSRSTHTGTQSADSIVDGLVNAAYTLEEKNKLSVLNTTVPPAHTHDNTSIMSLSYSKLTGVPETFNPNAHMHDMDEITTGMLPATRITETDELKFVTNTEKQRLANAESINNKGTPFGYAPLDGNGKINPSYLDALNVIDVFTPVNQEAMLLLTSAKPGDIAYVQDSQNTYMLVAMPVHLQDNWKQMNSGSGVITFNGLNGVVSVGTDQIPEGSANVYFTNERVDDRIANLLTPGENVSIVYNDDTNQIIISANDTSVEWSEIQNKPNTKIDVNLSGEISGSGSVTLSQLGNGTLNIENITSNTYEPRNSNIQGHIVNKTNPHNVTPAQIGLGNVDNTSDLDKPLSNPTKAYVDALISSSAVINKPVIISPVNSTIDFLGAIMSTYSLNSNYEGLQSKVVWECALDGSFNDIIDSYQGNDNLTSWTPKIGLALTTVYVRTKQGSDNHLSTWSDPISFTTPDIYVVLPTLDVAGAPSSVTLTPILTGNQFVVMNGTDTHASSDWQVLKASDRSVVWESMGNTVNKTSINTGTLPINTDLVFRVRYNGAIYGSSAWVEVTAKTLNIYVENPTITVEGTPNDVPKNPTISGSAFSVMNGTDTHESTDYQVVRVSDGLVVWESLGNTVNKTSIRTGDLVESTAYIFKMRYKGTAYGYSPWVQVTGTTKAVFSVAYGVEWNSATDTYLRTGAASGVANSTSYAGVIQTQMRRCVLNADGTVKYYLHPTDSTKKADGTPAIIDGSDGNVMVEIPKFWSKYEHVSGVHKWSISDGNYGPDYEVDPAFIRGGVEVDYRYYPAYEGFNLNGKLISGSGRTPTVSQTRAQFRALAAANGAGWSQIDWNLLVAVQLLYLTEYANFNSQAMIGRGNDTGSNYTMTTGGSNSIGNASSPSTNNDTWMSYRGIENWYASMFKFIDGVNVQERKYFINSNPATFADDVFTGDYVDSGITSIATNGYVSNLVPNKKGFVASAVAGSDSTYVPDYFYQNTGNRVVIFSGGGGAGLRCGAFCLSALFAASDSNAVVGSGVSF